MVQELKGAPQSRESNTSSTGVTLRNRPMSERRLWPVPCAHLQAEMMNELFLRRHGENVKPFYAGANRTSWAGKSTDAERPDGKVSGIVKRFSKKGIAAEKPTALGLVKTRFPHAIEFTGISHEVRGLIVFMGLFSAAIGIGFGQLFF